MKIAEYQQMMNYLTGPRERFNGGGSVRNKTILPKKKPEEEVKKRKIKNFEKLRSVLENPEEVKKMINKPKRGLVDEPGSYAGEGGEIRKTILANIDNIKSDYLKGLSIRSLKEKYFPDEDLDSVRTTLNRELDKVVSKKEKTARSKIEGTGQGAKGVRRQPLFKDPKKLVKFEKDISKLTLKELAKKYKINRNTISEYIRSNPELEKARVLAMSTPEMVNTRLEDIVDEIKDIKVSKQLKANSSEIKKISENLNRTPAQILSDINKIQLNPNRIKVPKNILNKINFFPKPIFAEDDIIMQGFSPKTAKVVTQVRDASAIVTEAASNLEHSLPKSIIREFKLPKKYTLTAERTTNFLNQFKKQFDNQLLKLAQSHALKEITYDKYKEEVNKIRKTVFDKTGGYKIGYVDFVDGKPVPVTEQKSLLKGQGEIGKRTTGLINYFKNSVFHNNLYKNYKANPKDPAFGTLRKEIKESKLKFVEEIEAEKTFNAIKNFKEPQDFFKFYKQNPNNVFFKALSKVAGLVGGKGKLLLGGAATFPFLASALSADEPDTAAKLVDEVALTKGPTGFPTKTEAGAALAAATAGTKTGRNLFSKGFKGLDRFLLRPLTAIEAPTLAIPQSLYQTYKLGSDIAKGQQTGVSAADITLPTSLSSFAASKKFGLDLFADNAGRIRRFLRGPFTQTGIRTLSRGSVFATPFIEAGIQGYNAYKALKEADKKADISEPRVDTALGKAPISYYNKIMSQLPAVDRFGAAGGGIMKMAGKSSGPAPESGPTPQGLDFLMKRGRQY